MLTTTILMSCFNFIRHQNCCCYHYSLLLFKYLIIHSNHVPLKQSFLSKQHSQKLLNCDFNAGMTYHGFKKWNSVCDCKFINDYKLIIICVCVYFTVLLFHLTQIQLSQQKTIPLKDWGTVQLLLLRLAAFISSTFMWGWQIPC